MPFNSFLIFKKKNCFRNESAGSEVGEQPPKDFYDSDDSELQMVFEVEVCYNY
jgi:hypothetical protein